jgi:hypothetical protein
MGVLQREIFKEEEKMNNKEYTERNIGLTFDFLRQVSDDPSILENISDGAIIEFIDKDYIKTEYPESQKPNRFIKVKNQFELID